MVSTNSWKSIWSTDIYFTVNDIFHLGGGANTTIAEWRGGQEQVFCTGFLFITKGYYSVN